MPALEGVDAFGVGALWSSPTQIMSTEKRPKIASFAVAASAILCLFIYSLDEPKPLSSDEAETLSSVSLMPVGGRIEIHSEGSRLVRVEPRDDEEVRGGEPIESMIEVEEPDAIDVAEAQASEARAAQTLRIIAMAQHRFQEARTVDINCDHLGEFGYLAELTGTAELRSGGSNSTQDVSELNAFLPPNFAEMVSTSEGGACELGGYLFAVYLPATPTFSGEVTGPRRGPPRRQRRVRPRPQPERPAMVRLRLAVLASPRRPAERLLPRQPPALQLSTPNGPECPAALHRRRPRAPLGRRLRHAPTCRARPAAKRPATGTPGSPSGLSLDAGQGRPARALQGPAPRVPPPAVPRRLTHQLP